MKRFGGVVPEIASREHLKALPLAVREATEQSGVPLSEIDWLAVTNRPGLVGALLVGVSFTKGLAYCLGKPFTALSHVEAHLYSPLLAESEGRLAPPFPWIALVVSGGHTELFHVKAPLEHTWLGGTLDDAAGEAFDKIGKLLGLPYPAGPRIDKWVREQGTDELRRRIPFPRARTEDYQFSYSGLKTAVSLQMQKLIKPVPDETLLAIAASAQEAILDPLVDKVRSAQKSLGVSQIVVTGGVACNSRLRERLSDASFPEPRHCSDNAAMVACLAGLHAKRGTLKPSPWEETVSPYAELG